MGFELLRGVSFGIPKRFAALLIFCAFSMNNGFAWLMFDPVDEELMQLFPAMSVSQLELLSSWQPFVYVVAFFPVMRLLTSRDGLRRAVKAGATMELCGALLKFFATTVPKSNAALPMLHLGQIMSAISSPVAIGAVSGLSAQWFDAEERTRATAAAVLSNNIGNAVCYLLVPGLTTGPGYIAVTTYEVLLAFVVACSAWLLFPEKVQRISVVGSGGESSSSGGVETFQGLKRQLRDLFSFPSAVLLLIVYSWSSGGYVAWTSMFDTMLGEEYGDSYVGTMSFFGTVAYVVGGLLSSYLTDLYFYRYMKNVIFACMTFNTISCLLFIASVPNESGKVLMDFGRVWILFVTSLCGLFNGAAAPIFYELIAEITYPIDESVSGGVASMCENLGALVLYQVVAKLFPATDMNYAFTFGMTLTIALSSLVQQKYNRSYSAVPTTEADGVDRLGSTAEEHAREMGSQVVRSSALYEKR
jgi:FLVCR family MFS transporter